MIAAEQLRAQLSSIPGAGIEADDDVEAINELVLSKNWGDGLPVVAPTAERVQAMLAYCDRPIDQPIAKIPPRYGEATPLRLAANAVMAGCKPEYFPLVLLAIEALCEEKFNLYGIQATTHPCSTLIVVNGPIGREIGMNGGHNAFGPGNRANATIGRAVRLAMWNIGGAIPASGDMATHGAPSKYTYCIAENEAANPWQPLNVEMGFSADTTTVTVYGAEAPHNVNDHESLSGEGLLKMIAGTIAQTGANNIYYAGEPLVVIGPEHAASIARDGYSKADVKKYLYENARVRLGALSDHNIERRLAQWKPYVEDISFEKRDALLPVIKAADGVHVIVAGGAGKHSMYIPTFGPTRPVTLPLKTRDGTLVKSIAELKQGA
jgi:hypothetical protein